MRFRLPVFPACLFLLLAGTSGTAMALLPAPSGDTASATQGPVFSTGDVALSSVSFDAAFDTIDNAYFADSLKLNYQINLLQKMVERQAELNKISQSMESLGASFEQPAPPRGICQQLPVNAPCLKAYPDLYPDVVSARKSHYAELNTPANAVVAPEQETPEQKAKRERDEKAAREKAAREASERAEKAARAERRNRYQWSDITCLNGQCRAVLVATKNPAFRATVREGSVLADGTVVRRVALRDIAVSINGDMIAVRPSPMQTAAQDSDKDKEGGREPSMTVPMDGKTTTVPMDANTTSSGGDSAAAKTSLAKALDSAQAVTDAASASPPPTATAQAGAGTGGSGGGS